MKPWKDNVRIVSEVNELSRQIFEEGWKADSVWQWLNYLEKEMTEFAEERCAIDVQAAYFQSMVNAIDFATLEKIRDSLKSLTTDLAPPRQQPAPSGVKSPSGSFWPQIASACEILDVGNDGEEQLLIKTAFLTQEKAKVFVGHLAELSILYQGFDMLFRLIAAALLYHTPPGAFVRFTAFREALQGAKAAKKQSEEIWPPIFRYLGQGLLGRDAEARDFAVYYLSANPIDEKTFQNPMYSLIYRLLLFLSWHDFADLSEENQESVVELHLWPALEVGVPVELCLKEKLGAEPFMNYFVYYSGFFAETMRQSNQMLFPERKDQVSVGQWIQSFLRIYPDKKDLLVENQRAYVDDQIRKNQWPGDKREQLFSLLSLYIHLRECNLVDYRNWLSLEGLEKPPYDWKTLIQKDIPEIELEKIQEYFRLVHRPVKLKMEILNAFGSVQWKDEPYLSRILALNEAYTDAYPEPYGPLVVFSETNGGWELNKEIRNLWKDFSQRVEEHADIFVAPAAKKS